MNGKLGRWRGAPYSRHQQSQEASLKIGLRAGWRATHASWSSVVSWSRPGPGLNARVPDPPITCGSSWTAPASALGLLLRLRKPQTDFNQLFDLEEGIRLQRPQQIRDGTNSSLPLTLGCARLLFQVEKRP